jgi:hypothetical protein
MTYLEIDSNGNKMQYFSLNIQVMDNFWTNETEINDDVFHQSMDIHTLKIDMDPD